MNRLFIILGALAAAGTVAWALLRESPAPAAASKPAAGQELPECCQAAPTRTSLLQKK